MESVLWFCTFFFDFLIFFDFFLIFVYSQGSEGLTICGLVFV